MWTRSLLKQNAKKALSAHYWRAVLVCFVAGIFIGSSGGSGTAGTENIVTNPDGSVSFDMPSYTAGEIIGIVVFSLVLIAISLALLFFVSNVVKVGYNRYFMEARVGNAPFSTLFSAFKKPYYMNIVKTMALYSVKIFLWSLLFIIPGIIKGLEYFSVSYILAENPGIDSQRAFELSSKMTDGEKANIFVLTLSFIGWYILGIITFGIGLLFLAPYVQATYAELYAAFRAKAFSAGFSDEKELGDFVKY